MNFKTLARTDYLFARPSFGSGIARTLDVFGKLDLYNLAQSDEEADARAIASDWAMVGQDLQRSIDRIAGE